MDNTTLTLNNEFAFTDQNFEDLRGMLTGHTGIELPESKKSLMYSRLVRRIRKLELASFGDYHDYVKSTLNQGNDKELMAMINAITTNVTHFFRENHHFEHLTDHLKVMFKKNSKIRIWSSAASIGAEPWSIAMVADRFKLSHPTADIKIMATDIDSKVLETCEIGKYDLKEKDVQENPYLKKYMKETKDEVGGAATIGAKNYKIDDSLRKYVTFKKLNLLDDWSSTLDKEYQFVFCRNVIIYFSKETQREVFEKMVRHMPAKSILYLGHSESLLNVTDKYKGLGRTIYERINDA